MKVLKNIFFTLLAILTTSCSHSSLPSHLTQIDELCETNPDSAIVALSKIEADSLKGEAAWFFSFLCQKAHLKANANYVANEDTLQLLAKHYEKAFDTDLKADVYYYIGCAYENLRLMPKAMEYFQKSLYFFTNDSMKGRCLFQIGNILIDQGLFQDALKSLEKSEAFMIRAKDDSWLCIVLRDIAWCHSRLNRRGMALAYYQRGLSLAIKIKDKEMTTYLNTQEASLLCDLKRYGDAEKALQKALEYNIEEELSPILVTSADIYRATGREAMALNCYRQLLKVGNLYGKRAANRELGKHYMKKGNIQEAWKYINAYTQIADSINKREAIETVSKMNALYNFQTQEQENAQLKESNKMKSIVAVIACMVCVILALLVVILMQRLKRKKIEWNIGKNVLKQIKKIPDNEDMKKLQEIQQSTIYRTFKDVCLNQRQNITEAEWQQLKLTIFSIYPGMSKALDSLPDISPSQVNLCLLIKARFTIVEMTKLTNRSRPTINSTRQRLCRKYFEGKSSVKRWDEFILSL